MATTLQQHLTTGGSANTTIKRDDPRSKRLVYSKYRELLGSYNDKANDMIQQLPAYMVKEDRGFHFDTITTDEVDRTVKYGVPPAPPPLTSGGTIPSQRLPTQVNQFNSAPACVQNAMMTKDKKPFTYTPGGIDLSQIKSPRMAKRIARNAQNEGISGQTKPSPLAQPNASPQIKSPSLATGMPVQVFPTGPPPPPPPSQHSLNNTNGNAPPPPPMLNQLLPQSTNSNTRKSPSPSPQNFEPPPFGFRPEIKIPPNPMAALKKVPRPRERNDFWVEEYRKDRSKSPMVEQDRDDYSARPEEPLYYNTNRTECYQQRSSPENVVPEYHKQEESNVDHGTQAQNTNTPLNAKELHVQAGRVESPYQSYEAPVNLQRPLSPIKVDHDQLSQIEHSSPVRRDALPQYPSTPPTNKSIPTKNTPAEEDSPSTEFPRSTRTYDQQAQYTPLSQQENIPIYIRSRDQRNHQNGDSIQTDNQNSGHISSIFIPTMPKENATYKQQSPQATLDQSTLVQSQPQNLHQAATPRWMTTRSTTNDFPSRVHEGNTVTQPSSSPVAGDSRAHISTPTGLRLQISMANSSPNPKERIIPIQIEKTPTPSKTPSTPGLGPQPYYNAGQQYSSVPSPPQANQTHTATSPNFVVRTPNQFVDQGYNNFQDYSQRPSQMNSPPGTKTRIIPIAVEENNPGQFNQNGLRGPISQSPLVIQNDPRTLQQQTPSGTPGNSTPNQSKSFRILQRITSTEDGNKSNNNVTDTNMNTDQAQLQGPHYSRQMSSGPQQQQNLSGSPTVDQMRRVQINEQDHQAFVNRVRSPQGTGQSPIMRYPQPPTYVQQRPIFEVHDQPDQQFIHPSQQKVPEPKKYTGSAIPSRSFKILQAMTTPENAGPGQSDL